MKKIIAIISALAIAAAMTGCKDDKGTAETSATTTAAETTAEATEAVEKEALETTTATGAAGDTTAPKADDAEAESGDEVMAERADGLWTVDLTNKAKQWPNNVTINISHEIDGVVSNITVETLGEKYHYSVESGDMSFSTQIFDGENTYIIDDETKTYVVGLVNAGGIDAFLLADDEMDSFTSSGTEEIDGKEYIYEEYVVMDIPTRYYFNEVGEVAYYSMNLGDEITIMELTVDFADETDESVFAVPSDYTEISQDEYKLSFTE